MKTLLDKISFEHKPYVVNDEIGKYAIEKIAEILKPLESEIISNSKAAIIVFEQGYFDLVEFPPDLEKQVRDLISASS